MRSKQKKKNGKYIGGIYSFYADFKVFLKLDNFAHKMFDSVQNQLYIVNILT